jgi:hypothetical protein
LPARAEGALGHFFHDIVAADGFNDFFLGFIAFIVIVVMLVAMRRGGMFVVGWNGVGFTGVLTVAVLGVRRVVGMGGVFARVLLVEVLVMRMFFVRFWRYRGRCLDRHRHRHIGRGFNGRRFARVNVLSISVFMLMLMIV